MPKDGRKVILRTLKWDDLDDLLDFINSLVEEGANILRTEKVSRDEEIEMMKALEEHARKIGLKVLSLSVFANNQNAINLYRKMGFVETGRIPKRFFKDGAYIDEIIMTKMLK